MSKECFDHLGNKFRSKSEMAGYWGLNLCTFIARRNRGKSLEEALTTPMHSPIDGDKCEDHLGNIFRSKSEMAGYWGLSTSTIQDRLNEGKTLEEVLTKQPKHLYPCKDHLGNQFRSKTEMAKYWGLNLCTIQDRLNKGKSLEEALTTPIKIKHVYDPFGNNFKTIEDMCNFYNKTTDLVRGRLKNNHSIAVSLDISLLINSRRININQTKYNLTVVKRIAKGKDVFECYIDNGDGTSTFRIMTYEMIDEYCLEQYKKSLEREVS